MTTQEFEERAKINGGYDRIMNEWKIIDVHQIPEYFAENMGCDFYCCNGRSVYMLQLVYNKNIEEYSRVDDTKFGYPPYLIARLPIENITDEFILSILSKFDL